MVSLKLLGAHLSADILERIRFRLSQEDIPGAVDLAKSAYLNNTLDPLVLNLVSFDLENKGDFEGALRVLGEAVTAGEDDPQIFTSIGHCLLKLARPTHAIEAFNRALRRDPKLPRAHHGVGLAYWMRGDFSEGDEAHYRAIQLDPNYPDPYGALAVAYSQRGEAGRALQMAKRALALNPNELQAHLVEADLLFENGEIAANVSRLRGLLADVTVPPLQRAAISRRLGNGLDRLGEFAEAYEAYTAANACLRRVYRDLFEVDDIESLPAMCRRLSAYFTQVGSQDFPALVHGRGVREHVFLMGFPRSGTTLLEQVLASHPEILALEERPTLHESITAYFRNKADIATLMNASDADLQTWRDLYWNKVEGFIGDVAGKVFVDKQPSLPPYIPLIRKLFPSAKIIFCIRDPRDVVFSCFRHGFTMNTNIYEFTDIIKLSELYSFTMECAEVYFSKLNCCVYIHKHEEFIEKFDQKIIEICNFLGLDYDQNMRNFSETAKLREINTPSRDQVRAGLSTKGVAYWRNYAPQLAAACEVISPWIKKFGYQIEDIAPPSHPSVET